MIALARACRGVRVECASTSRSAAPAARRSPSVISHMPSMNRPMPPAVKSRLVMGSVATQVLASCKVPVPLVR